MLFDLSGWETGRAPVPGAVQPRLDEAVAGRPAEFLADLSVCNGQWFDSEMDKLDRWADDRQAALKAELEELDDDTASRDIDDLHRQDAKSAKAFLPVLRVLRGE